MFSTEEEGREQLNREDNLLAQLGLLSPSDFSSAPIQPILPVAKDLGTPPSDGTRVEELQDGVNEIETPGSPSSEPDLQSQNDEPPMRSSTGSSSAARGNTSATLKMNRMLRDVAKSSAGRYPGIRNRTDKENASIAIVGQLTTQAAASNMFGVTTPQVSHLEHGATSPQMRYGEKGYKPQLRAKIEELGGTIVDRAFSVINDCIDNLTPDRIAAVKTVQVSKIARDMSSLVRDITPRESNDAPGVHFHIWRPELAEESDYGEVVNIRAINKE